MSPGGVMSMWTRTGRAPSDNGAPASKPGRGARRNGWVENSSVPHWSPGLEAGDTARNAVRAMASAKLQ